MNGNATLAPGRVGRRLRRAGPLLALCALLGSSCSAATAGSWQCHAPEGTFADHDMAVSRAATEFSGEMAISKANGRSDWRPTARVAFNDLGLADSGCHCNGVVATGYREHPHSLLVSLVVDGKEVPLGLVPDDKPVRFKLSFTWDGALRLEVGNRVATGRSSTLTRNNLLMSCSTADVDFEVTVVPPVPPSAERCAVAAREQWSAADIDRYCRVRH